MPAGRELVAAMGNRHFGSIIIGILTDPVETASGEKESWCRIGRTFKFEGILGSRRAEKGSEFGWKQKVYVASF